MVNICLGHILYWNDTEIVALNPDLKDVSKAITHVVPGSTSTATLLLTTALSNASPIWQQKYGALFTWPSELYNITSIRNTLTHVFSAYADVFAHEYTISIASFSFFYTIEFADGIDYAGFKLEGIHWGDL